MHLLGLSVRLRQSARSVHLSQSGLLVQWGRCCRCFQLGRSVLSGRSFRKHQWGRWGRWGRQQKMPLRSGQSGQLTLQGQPRR